MVILPISQISEQDQELFGSNLYHLAQLKRAGLAVPDGLAVSPPDFLLQTVLKHFGNAHQEVFEQKLALVKADIAKTPLPDGLDRQSWRKLLDYWLAIIKSRIWAQGFNQGICEGLPAQLVYPHQGTEDISAYADSQTQDIVIQSPAKLSIEVVNQIKKMVIAANRKLLIPQQFQFLISKKVYIVAVTPYTEPVTATQEQMEKVAPKEQELLAKSAVKVFANLPQGFADLGRVDGVLIESERFLDPEQLTFRLTETALHYPQQPIILKLAPTPAQFKDSVDTLNFLRNRQGLLNLQLGIPVVRSVNEYSTIKKELAAQGLTRKSLLQFWLSMGTPENLLNSEQYLEVGLDGIILDLDSLHQLLFGYQGDEGEFYKHEVKTLVSFLESNLKAIHQTKAPILAYGIQVFHPDVLHFLVDNGVWGVVANTIIEAESLPETLSWVESRALSKKVSL